MDTYQPNYKFIDYIEISKIIFDGESSDVTLFGYIANEDKTEYLPWDFACSLGILTDILLQVGDIADPIIGKLTEILGREFIKSPSVIDIVNMLGREISVRELVLKVYIPQSEDEKGEWVEDPDENCYYIDSIIFQSDFIKDQKREKQFSEYQDMQADHFILLNNAFNYYTRLTRRGVVEKKARKMSGLSHKLFLRIAFVNNQMISLSK